PRTGPRPPGGTATVAWISPSVRVTEVCQHSGYALAGERWPGARRGTGVSPAGLPQARRRCRGGGAPRLLLVERFQERQRFGADAAVAGEGGPAANQARPRLDAVEVGATDHPLVAREGPAAGQGVAVADADPEEGRAHADDPLHHVDVVLLGDDGHAAVVLARALRAAAGVIAADVGGLLLLEGLRFDAHLHGVGTVGGAEEEGRGRQEGGEVHDALLREGGGPPRRSGVAARPGRRQSVGARV